MAPKKSTYSKAEQASFKAGLKYGKKVGIKKGLWWALVAGIFLLDLVRLLMVYTAAYRN